MTTPAQPAAAPATQAAPLPAASAPARPAAKARRAKSSGDSRIRCIDQWPAHPGWKRWLFRVWDKASRSYVNESFDDGEKAKGWAWAEHQRALLSQGKTGAGVVLFEAVALRYVEDLRKAGKSEPYVEEVERLAAAVVAAGATDLRDQDFARKVRDWIAAAPCFYESQKPAGPKSHRPALANLEARLARAEQLVTTCTAKERGNYARRLEHWRERVARARERAQARVRTPSAITRNRWLVILKSIGRSARRFGVIDNPLSEIKPFKQDKPVKTALRVDELRAMVADDRAGDAYYRLACLLVYTGMRVGEAAHVRWEWIDLEGRTITIAVIRTAKGDLVWGSKGNKGRIVPILDELAELLAAWRAADVAAGGTGRTGWLIGDGEQRLEDKGHWLAFREYLGRCGIDAAARDLSPHCTRHTWTAIRLATGVSPNRLRLELGHEKLETTDIYAGAEQLYDKVVKDWPRGELCLRHPPRGAGAQPAGFVLDCDRDPREVLDLFLARGGKVEQLAAAAGVPAAVLRTWLLDGIPDAVRHYLAVLAASARLAAAGTEMPGAALPAPRPAIGGASTPALVSA